MGASILTRQTVYDPHPDGGVKWLRLFSMKA
jgi:hypothetical protein